MRAIKDHFGTVNGVVAAMAAGVDLVFISHDTLLSGQAARAAEQAVAEGRLSAAEMQASVQRILALKEKWVDGMPEGGFDFDAARRENEALLQKTITEVHRPAGGRPALGSAPLCIGCPAYRTSLVGNVDAGETNRFGDGMARALHGSAAAMQPEPGREEIAALVELAPRPWWAPSTGACAGASWSWWPGWRRRACPPWRWRCAARTIWRACPKACGRWRHSSIRSRAFGRLRACCAARPNQPEGCP